MKTKILSFCIGILSWSISAQNLSIIPQPQSVEYEKGVFLMGNDTNLDLKEGNLTSENIAFLKMVKQLPRANQNGTKTFLQLRTDSSMTRPESYRLRIGKEELSIVGADPAGVFYGLQTLQQIISQSPDGLPCLTIEDYPQFSYRGMHLDVARHFFPVDYIKTYIDLIALHKMNRFHWHLTEDQGWRIEIKAYPKLTSVGAYRDETIMGWWSSRTKRNPSFDGVPYGGFYTQEEVREIVAYAAERHVTVIPEIEMPGHARAAITAYPELGNFGEQYEVAKTWGVFPQIFAPSETTFTFLETVLNEVMDLFPSTYIHIGGDEAPKLQWEKSEQAQALIKSLNLKDEHELQSYFIQRIEKILNNRGRSLIGWDEILEGGLAPNATVMSWRGESGGIAAAKAGHPVIMTPTDYVYFDYYQAEPTREEPLAIGGYLPLKKVYNYNPVPKQLSKSEAKYVLGSQGNVWTEYMKTPSQVNYMVLPRMTALSEVVWSDPNKKDYEDFLKRLQLFKSQYQRLGVNYASHLID